MIEVSIIVQCYAAMAAYRAAEPARFAAETGIAPEQLGWRAAGWRRGARALGTVLVGTATGVAWHAAGAFEGLILASAAAMASAIAVILLAPLARRVVWSSAAVCLALAPFATVAALLWGGGYGG